MASRSRRSKLAKDNEKEEDESTNLPEGRITRRRSSIGNGLLSIAKQNSHSERLDEIFENDIGTPSKKTENKFRKCLKPDEILQDLEEYANEELSDRSKKERTGTGTPKKLRPTVGKVNYNEDVLMEEHEKSCRNKISESIKSQASKHATESSPRKRPNQNTQQDSVDNNDMQIQIKSPPKRSKSDRESEFTPKKNHHLENLPKTPRSAAKRKINLSEPKNARSSSRVRTRNSTMHCEGKYAEWSSSDENTKKKVDKEAKVVLEKLKPVPKRSISRTIKNKESEESETENKMYNANRNTDKKSTRAKSVQKDSEVQPFSPSKAMQKLNINRDMGTPKTSRILIKELQAASTPNGNVNTGTPRRSGRNAPKFYNVQKSSDEESADSSDDYKEEDEESSESSEDSPDSSADSAEEFQLSRRRKLLKTPRKNAATRKVNKRVTKVSMDTPTKAISRMSIGTPSLDKHRRTINISKPTTPLQKARATLHVSVLPKSLPCREEQFNDIYSFLHARLSDGSGGCIYISGVPGTGKTATVSEVICCLKKSMAKGELDNFDYIDINGMKLSEPRQAYVQIWRQMTGETKTWEESHKLLQNRFINSNSKRNMTLLLVDELDLLCTKRQDVVYNLLDWPSKANAKLVVVTIANTMDLPERILMGKVTSRLGLTRLTFPPYTFKQLEEIVVSRLRGANAFGGETIQLVARKVAAVSGDARRALDICRRSAEIAEKNDRELVSMLDVKQALDEMIASPKIQAIRHCSVMEKYFLQAVCTEVHRTGVEEVVFKNVYMQMQPLCSLDGLKAPNTSEALEICARLGSWRLLLCDHSRMDIHQRLLLNVTTDDVYFATKNFDA